MALPLPTRRLVKRLVEDIPAFERYTARYGHDAALRRFRSVEGHRVTHEPLERAEIDHTNLDLFAIDDETLLPLGRPWFSACEDDYTRCILGMFVGFIPPSFLTVSLCLKDAFRPKTWLKQVYPDIRSDWPAHGVMRELVLDNGPEFHSDSLELPGSYLEVMSLQPLLSLVGMLGRRRMVVDNDCHRRNSQRIVFTAASVLGDWPSNFFRLLRGITEGSSADSDSSTGVARGRLGGIYRSLRHLRRIVPTEQADFLRIAFLDFIRNQWRPDFIDQKLMKQLRTGESERFISRAAFARRYGIDTRAAARFVEDQGVPLGRSAGGSRSAS